MITRILTLGLAALASASLSLGTASAQNAQPAAATPTAPTTAAAPTGPTSNKWRIKMNGHTRDGGTLVFRVAETGAEPKEVSVEIPKGTSENSAAEKSVKALKAALGKGFHVERDDWEDVLIKKRGKTRDFGVTLVSSSVAGLDVSFHRE